MDPMLTDSSSFPRISAFVPECDEQVRPPLGFQGLAKDFEAATGWVLDFEPLNQNAKSEAFESNRFASGRVTICDMSANWPAEKNAASREHCDRLADRISGLYRELSSVQIQLQATRSKAATGNGLGNSSQKSNSGLGQEQPLREKVASASLSRLFKSLLNSACELGHADSAALFLLDEKSKELRTDCVHGPIGLPTSRTLQNSVADIEALSGSVVVMDDALATEIWGCPVSCGSAVCMPVSSMNELFGTIWIFSKQEQDYSAQITNVLEIISGRIAAELELQSISSESTAVEVSDSAVGFRELEPVWEMDESELTLSIAPPFDGWNIQSTENTGVVNWWVTPSEQMVAVVGNFAFENGMGNGKGSQAIEMLMKASDEMVECDSSELLGVMERSLDVDSTRSNGSASILVLDPLTGEFQLSRLGNSIPVAVRSESGDVEIVLADQLENGIEGLLSRGQSIVMGGRCFEPGVPSVGSGVAGVAECRPGSISEEAEFDYEDDYDAQFELADDAGAILFCEQRPCMILSRS